MKSGWSDRLRDTGSLVKMAAAEEVEAARVTRAGSTAEDKRCDGERVREGRREGERKRKREEGGKGEMEERKKNDRDDKRDDVVWWRWDLN